MKKAVQILIVLVTCLLGSVHAFATVTYDYRGAPFTDDNDPIGILGAASQLSGYVVFKHAVINGVSGFGNIQEIYFTDGQSIAHLFDTGSADGTSSMTSYFTFAGGNIVSWELMLSRPFVAGSYGLEFATLNNAAAPPVSDYTRFTDSVSAMNYAKSNFNAPGVWTQRTVVTHVVPEPETWMLMLTGAWVVCLRRRNMA